MGYAVKTAVRKACLQMVAAGIVIGGLLSTLADHKEPSVVAFCMIQGLLISPFAYALYRFARFLIVPQPN